MACTSCNRTVSFGSFGAGTINVDATPTNQQAQQVYDQNPANHAGSSSGMIPTMCANGMLVPFGVSCDDTTPWYKTPVGILGILAVLGGGLYFYKRRAA